VDRRTFGKATVVAFAGLGLRSTLPLTPAFGAPPTFADSFPQVVDGVLQEPAGILYQEAEDGFLPGGADGQVKSGLVTPDLDFTEPPRSTWSCRTSTSWPRGKASG